MLVRCSLLCQAVCTPLVAEPSCDGLSLPPPQKSSLPMPPVIPSIRGGEQGKRNGRSDKIILSLLQHRIKAKQALFREMGSGAYFVRQQHLEFELNGAEF